MLGIVAVGVVRESRKFRAPIYRAHRAVIFATAQLSCSFSCSEKNICGTQLRRGRRGGLCRRLYATLRAHDVCLSATLRHDDSSTWPRRRERDRERREEKRREGVDDAGREWKAGRRATSFNDAWRPCRNLSPAASWQAIASSSHTTLINVAMSTAPR